MSAVFDMNALLLDLAAAGWRPVVHPKAGRSFSDAGELVDGQWVCFPESSVREFHIGEGPTPEAAVAALHRFAFGPRETASPLPTAEEAMEAREARIREAAAMGWSASA